MSRYDATPVGLVAPYRTVADAFIDILWIEGSCYFVGCCFIILAAAGLVLSVIELTSKKKGEWKLRPIALLLLMVFCIMESIFWFILSSSSAWMINSLYFFFAIFPSVIFWQLQFLCMYLYGTIYYQVYFAQILSDYEIILRQQRRAKIQVFVSVLSLAIQLIMYGVYFVFDEIQNYEYNLSIVLGSQYIVSGVAFPVYFSYLHYKRHTVGDRKYARMQHRLLQCFTVSLLMSFCLVVRGVILFSWGKIVANFAREIYWVFCVVAYAVVEMLPVFFLLVLLKVVSLQSVIVVGSNDSEYWKDNGTKNVEGIDFISLHDQSATENEQQPLTTTSDDDNNDNY